MKEKNTFISLVVFIILLAAILLTDIGYANENILNYNINNNTTSSEFDVSFNTNSDYQNNNIKITSSKTATFENIILNKVGETEKFIIPITNNSNTLSANISSSVSNTNPEYFKVTCNMSKSILQPKSDEAFIEVSIELIKLPLNSIERTDLLINLLAEPIY